MTEVDSRFGLGTDSALTPPLITRERHRTHFVEALQFLQAFLARRCIRRELPEGFKRAFGTGMIPIITLNLFIGYLGRGFIDNAAHVGGLLSGAALAVLVLAGQRHVADRRRPRGDREHAERHHGQRDGEQRVPVCMAEVASIKGHIGQP